jgi:hypothetical protein
LRPCRARGTHPTDLPVLVLLVNGMAKWDHGVGAEVDRKEEIVGG